MLTSMLRSKIIVIYKKKIIMIIIKAPRPDQALHLAYMTYGKQAGHLIILLSNNSHTWVLTHIRAHVNIHMGQVTKPRLSRYPTLPSTDSKTR